MVDTKTMDDTRDPCVSVRLPQEILDRVDALRNTYTRADGEPASRSDVLRLLVESGLQGVERKAKR